MAKKSERDEIVFLEDVVDCIDKIELYLEGMTEEEFEENSEKQDAVLRRIEIIGEAVKNISSTTRQSYSDIPWREMAGMRDVIIHNYFGISIGLVWKVATSDLPPLRDKIKNIIADML